MHLYYGVDTFFDDAVASQSLPVGFHLIGALFLLIIEVEVVVYGIDEAPPPIPAERSLRPPFTFHPFTQ
jgi:hypothetical protein